MLPSSPTEKVRRSTGSTGKELYVSRAISRWLGAKPLIHWTAILDVLLSSWERGLRQFRG